MSRKRHTLRKPSKHTQKEDYISSNQYLESLLDETQTISYDPACVRKKSNLSKGLDKYKFDSVNFSGEELLNKIPTISPKLHELLGKIQKLDTSDMKEHGKKFKHFIFSDVKSGAHGARLVASALIAKGYHLGYSAELKKPADKDAASATAIATQPDETEDAPEKREHRYKKLELNTDAELMRNPNTNFFLLSSVMVYDQPITVAAKKQMLAKFNQRPENIHGDLARIIVLDSGFKEGIDLFDVKYVHIFEPSIVPSDQKQVIGRGTRTCGQKGLEFHPSRGWPLHIFVYDLSIPEKVQGAFLGAENAIDLYLKSMNIDIRQFHFAHDLEKSTVLGSVDYDLNKNIHTFSIPSAKNIERLPGGSEFVYGGAPKLRIRQPEATETTTSLVLPGHSVQSRKTYSAMRQYIKDYFKEYTWDVVKMTNMCAETMNGGGNVLKYTPSQNFIRNYFTPLNPCKGMLLWHSVGTGKTCSAIATATSSFEKQEYTILWVTRTTLKNDIWKNMFDQVCNESIRNKIEYTDDFTMPKEHAQRMRLLSKSWKIRPISYKQFSNLVSKQNSIYETLVKINGEADPLRKTLIIIDEAHKLYGGDDLSGIERPDMNALHTALMKSYEISGDNSVRLMLMTATPITTKPMELVQLINLCKPLSEQMPATFDEFSNEYLDVQGEFTETGRYKYLDDIAGYVSYLNREKDARQFAQPIVTQVSVPMVKNEELIEKFDKKFMREQMSEETKGLQMKLVEKAKEIEGELSDLDKNKFGFLKKEVCETFENVPKKQCDKVVNANIRGMVAELKNLTAGIRAEMKEMKGLIKAKKGLKRETIGNIKENIEQYADEYQEYKDSVLYNIKNDCAVRPDKGSSALKENVKGHPAIVEIDTKLEEYTKQIEAISQSMKIRMEAHKQKVAELRNMLKNTQYNDLERSVIRMTLKERHNEHNQTMKIFKKENAEKENLIQKNIQQLTKGREKRFKKIQKTIKKKIGENKQKIKEQAREETRLRKELRKQADYKEEITNKQINDLVETYREKMVDELHNLDESMLEKERAKEAEKQRKADAREQKQLAREQKAVEREEKKKTRKAEQEKKKAEREQARKTKKNAK
jgi:hypothetical protein